ncbi:hypothetical protein C3L50_03625 [Flavobacterium alvei]|uniref:DUF5777 domain-containing protein n=1 Tax=Flavobacterium alvei TaxID=2080416 RepID=A0A2S5AF54_9FLAO|nr:DUF5777 family beta-barrel protein [Flavobacterium alvei]POY40929.1 hypothetical protein C3L50_03625 [Flavobacterium alvei]
MKKFFSFVLVLFTIGYASAQDDLLNQLNAEKTDVKDKEKTAFKGLQICNIQSTKMTAKGEWYMVISHRFGNLTEGLDNFFGLDNALTKIGGIYGVTDWLSLGASRHTYNKIYEVTAKYKLADQITNGFPVTIVGYNTMDINTALSTDLYPNLQFNNRLAYSTQLLASRKFSEGLSFEIGGVYVHKNLYDDAQELKDQYLVAAGGRCKLSKRLSVNLDYAYKINQLENAPLFQNPLTLGLDIETGGHVFQMVFSNSQPMNDVAVFTNATGKWNGGSLYFGFNMYRVF